MRVVGSGSRITDTRYNNRYDNILISGDLNIDPMDPNDQGFKNLIDFLRDF